MFTFGIRTINRNLPYLEFSKPLIAQVWADIKTFTTLCGLRTHNSTSKCRISKSYKRVFLLSLFVLNRQARISLPSVYCFQNCQVRIIPLRLSPTSECQNPVFNNFIQCYLTPGGLRLTLITNCIILSICFSYHITNKQLI